MFSRHNGFWRSFEDTYHEHPYYHPRYMPGHWVLVKESLRELHLFAPAAGKIVKTCWGTYPSSDDVYLQCFIDWQEQARPHETYVPVLVDGKVWLIEEEYVEFLD